ncbi:MAG TPA: sulfurtransferase TusA family protein [Actinomycetota bacterium]|nr:sulfurtransferase TusA family protein [Actinomycetota bacterium]
MASRVQADKVLDVKGLLCPLPVIKLSKAIKEIDVGQIVEMQATDPGAEPDMDAWVKNTGHEMVDHTAEGDVFTFWVRRTK